MRVLNKRQKKALDAWFETIKHEAGLAVGDVVADLLPVELWEKLQRMGDHETIYQNINRYINDKACKVMYGR